MASRNEVKNSLGLIIGKKMNGDRPVNLFKKKKSPPMSNVSEAPLSRRQESDMRSNIGLSMDSDRVDRYKPVLEDNRRDTKKHTR